VLEKNADSNSSTPSSENSVLSGTSFNGSVSS
jgi:hypothetical protein